MGLGPRWESAFISPGPPAGKSAEWTRYIAQLHDQLTVSFKQAQDIINQTIIVGDGDGGPGIQGTTETDGGTIDMDINVRTNIVQLLDFGGANSDWTDSRTQETAALNSIVGSNFRMLGDSIVPGTVNLVHRWTTFMIKDWASVNLWMASNGVSNNGVQVEFDLQYIVGIDSADDWDVAYSTAVRVNWTPTSGSTLLKKLRWVIVGNVEETWGAFQLTVIGKPTPQDQAFLWLGMEFA